MAKINYNIKTIRGDTYKSPTWILTEEDIPPNISYQQFQEGITNGTYHPIDLSIYEITGQVRANPTGSVIINLPIVVNNGHELSFTIPATTTEAFVNQRHVMGYDIQFKEIATGEVTTWLAGSFEVTTDYTHNDIN